MTTDHAAEVKNLLSDPWTLISSLGWGDRAKRQARGFIVRCPAHGDKDPSCSIRVADDGRLQAKCFSCGWGADALGMIALAHNLDPKTDFKEILAIGADIGGHYALAEEIREGRKPQKTERKPIPAPEPVESNDYPERAELGRFWQSLGNTARDGRASAMLVDRLIDPAQAASGGLSRVIRPDTRLPDWASYRRQFWTTTGHTLILPVWDCSGRFRSVRSWRVTKGDSPKRLPPANCKAKGLCMANLPAVKMLQGKYSPLRVLFVEGEPDFLTWATRTNHAVIGVGSGMWTEEHAKSIGPQTSVYIRTHHDPAGEKYADNIKATLSKEHRIFRA
tara:strand:+ start:380 stop:1381 length:1002 start_codon:yes stop_codon:yes gene_type:complete